MNRKEKSRMDKMEKMILIRNDKWKCPAELYVIASSTDSLMTGGDSEEVELMFIMELGRIATCDDSLMYEYLGDEKTALAAVAVETSDFTEEDDEGCVFAEYRPRFGRKRTKAIVRCNEEVEELDIDVLGKSQNAKLYPDTLCLQREIGKIGKEERIEKSIDAFKVGLDTKHGHKDCLATLMFVFDDGFSRCDIAGIDIRKA